MKQKHETIWVNEGEYDRLAALKNRLKKSGRKDATPAEFGEILGKNDGRVQQILSCTLHEIPYRFDVKRKKRSAQNLTPSVRLQRIREIIEHVETRAMAADGDVTNTRHEMTDKEMRQIYELAGGKVQRKG